jgi:hypothetical protein
MHGTEKNRTVLPRLELAAVGCSVVYCNAAYIQAKLRRSS